MTQAGGLRLDHVEYLLAENADQLLGIEVKEAVFADFECMNDRPMPARRIKEGRWCGFSNGYRLAQAHSLMGQSLCTTLPIVDLALEPRAHLALNTINFSKLPFALLIRFPVLLRCLHQTVFHHLKKVRCRCVPRGDQIKPEFMKSILTLSGGSPS
jgi:hypothetical protein